MGQQASSPWVKRRRQATLQEIRTTARRLLRQHGPGGVTVNAVAREMGMSGPAVYRYYASHDALVEAVITDFYEELTTTMLAARDAGPPEHPGRRLLSTCRAMRTWAIDHPSEFGWMFASPALSAAKQDEESPRLRAGQQFEKVFLDQFVDLWERAPYPVPDFEDLPPSIQRQMTDYSARTNSPLPPEALHLFLSSWIKLYGLLCMEILHQLDFAYSDLEPVFEENLQELCAMHDLTYEPPSAE
ncbi:TetR family transcriptional regulator [Streptomyces abyssalis]|uniref:TetR family transcriptional regulator n=1 Tax=Streptomyces abyssalis TaxID=933944 RepID=A0A1E7JQ75_9ACTN|nr:TetR/AcrR family transcriptional regulator [Streptomyces abyssalis]OEU90442.1 TetR family transcriptional regulator [Streptomyces abyssalis]OEU95178.1 TetR family transcriptional regulator [Streptomyces abyssalis]OEV29305.1 TetR family transcriptional regulator [Streptomyces nanshensis]